MPKKPRKPPRPGMRMHEAELCGDASEFFSALNDAERGTTRFDLAFPKLLRLFEAESKKNPAAFAQKMLQQGTTLIGFLMSRIDFTIRRSLTAFDNAQEKGLNPPLPVDVCHSAH